MEYTPIDEAVDEIRHYLNVNFTEFDRAKIFKIIEKVRVRIIRRTTTEKIYLFANNVKKNNPPEKEMDALADEVCKQFGITITELRTPLKKGGVRTSVVVNAKKEFIKRLHNGNFPCPAYIGSYMGMHRTSIMYHRDDQYGNRKLKAYKKMKNGQNTRV